MTTKNLSKVAKLRGNPGKRKVSEEPFVDLPDNLLPPSTLSRKAKSVWLDVAPAMHKAGILTFGDRHMFTVYCETYAQWHQAQTYIRRHMNATTGQEVTDLNLRMKIADKCQAQLLALSQQFGMTPTSRKHVPTVKPEGGKFGSLRAMKNEKAA